MVTFADLRDTRLGSLAEAAGAWRSLARQMGALEERVGHDLTGQLRSSGWAGAAADAAYRRLDLVDGDFALAMLQSRMVAAVLDTAASRLAGIQQRLHAALDAAALLRLRVDETGMVRPAPVEEWQRHTEEGRVDRAREVENAGIYTELIRKLVAEATEHDADVQHALDRLRPDRTGGGSEWADAVHDAREAGGLFGVELSAIPGRGTDPERVAAWWRGLTEDERQLYLAAYPERVGAMDGLPAVDRDEANRLALRARLGELEMAAGYSEQDERDRRRLTSLLSRLETAEHGPPAQRLFLLGLATAGDGQAVVSVGNPDTARHTAVIVPGVGTDLDGIRGEIDRAARLQAQADDFTFGVAGDVAVVAWLGYDAPGADASAIGYQHAQAGAPRLDDFVDGLVAAHPGDPGHLSVVGHSYGSTVVGEAASHGDGLAVTDIITAGSPGMHVDTAEELQIDPRHVWAGAADKDPISGVLGSIPFIHDNEPSDRDFGANRYHVDTTGHSAYWRDGSVSLQNQARIVVGQYDYVTLDHGSVPR